MELAEAASTWLAALERLVVAVEEEASMARWVELVVRVPTGTLHTEREVVVVVEAARPVRLMQLPARTVASTGAVEVEQVPGL